MALSQQAQEVVAGLGYPYRHTVITTTALALAAALGLRALALSGVAGRRIMAVCVVTIFIAAATVYAYPRNMAATRGHRLLPGQQSIERVYWEVVLGDPTVEGDRRRCDAFADVEATNGQSWVQTILRSGARDTYQYFHGARFCTRWKDDAP